MNLSIVFSAWKRNNIYLSYRLLQTVTYTETQLLDGLQSHDEQAFSFLYDRYSKALFSIILQIIPNQEIAEDVLQEVFVKIWQNIKSYDETKGRLYTWMLNIARNQAIDRTRSKDFGNRAKTTELSENVYSERLGTEAKIDDVGLKKTLSNLPEENRKLLELAYFQGYTQEEIAKILNIPLGTVKTRIRTTIIQLRKILSAQ
jgi:RNA polymerase sigma-70 factor (ECF subfamily)